MQDFDKTTYFKRTAEEITSSTITVFDGDKMPYTLKLNEYGKSYIHFGRDSKNDIVLTSKLVSAEHGRFVYKDKAWFVEDKAVYKNIGSTNGLIYNNSSIKSHYIADGDFIRIDDGIETVSDGVLFVFSSADSNNKWSSLPIDEKRDLTIGRDKICDIVLPHISVSKCHAKITCENGDYYISDNNSTNGVIINNKPLSGKVRLHEKDVIVITNSKLIFTSNVIYYCCYKNGVSVDASNIVIKRGKGKKSFITCNHVNLNINPGELVHGLLLMAKM